MKKTILATLAAALIASVAVPAMAASQRGDHERGPRIERLMERFDTDRDGVVMPEEVSAHRLAMFESADTDSSGSLSQDELRAFGDMRKEMRQQNREERRAKGKGAHRGGMKLERLDSDKNGEISLEEFASIESKMFERFDRNGDNKIDVTDFYRSADTGKN